MDGYTETFDVSMESEIFSAVENLIRNWQIRTGEFGESPADVCVALHTKDKGRIESAIGAGGQSINLLYKDTKGIEKETKCAVLSLNGRYLRIQEVADAKEKSVRISNVIRAWH